MPKSYTGEKITSSTNDVKRIGYLQVNEKKTSSIALHSAEKKLTHQIIQ